MTDQASSKAAFAPKSTQAEASAATSQKGKLQKASPKLEGQAATAALYVTKSQRNSGSEGTKPGSEETWLDRNNKLSSAGAAASLKYATAKDLPSYPSSGLPLNASAASAAASQGWANQKSFEHWKPEASSAASAAALLAHDHKTNPVWQPQQSSNGAKAAVLAHRDAAKVDTWKPEPSAWGNSAALIAVQTQKKGTPSPQLNHGHKDLGRQGSLLAATGAMAGSRRRAESTPIIPAETYPDQANAVANALSAATVAHKPSQSTKHSPNGTTTAVTNLPREMYTSSPLVGPEVEERERTAMLRASAVAMAQKMYSIQQKHIDAAAQDLGGQAAASAYGRERTETQSSGEGPSMRFNNLQEAAQKLAQQRLSKLHDEHSQAREYREYYGDSKSKQAPQKRLSVNMSSPRGRTRARASSEGAADNDQEQSQKIRAQMSLFSSNLSKVDAKKRQEDREALIAIAQRNVANSLHGMDEQVFEKTGKVNASLQNEWEIKAKAAAQAKSDGRMQNFGKVNIGGGKFVDQSDVDTVAARNVQPALDDITEKATAEHARQAEIKADQEANKRTEESKKQREKEEKDIQKRLKQQEKDEVKAAKEEEKRLAKEEKRKSREGRKSFILSGKTKEPVAATEAAAEPTAEQVNTTPIALEPDEVQSRTAEGDQLQEDSITKAPSPPDSLKAGGRVKSWFKTTFASVPHTRSTSKSQKEPGAFLGGAALTKASASQTSIPKVEEDEVPTTGAGAAAIGGTNDVLATKKDEANRVGRSKKRAGSDASASLTGNEDEEFEEARDNFDEEVELKPPARVGVDAGRGGSGAGSPGRETRFREEI